MKRWQEQPRRRLFTRHGTDDGVPRTTLCAHSERRQDGTSPQKVDRASRPVWTALCQAKREPSHQRSHGTKRRSAKRRLRKKKTAQKESRATSAHTGRSGAEQKRGGVAYNTVSMSPGIGIKANPPRQGSWEGMEKVKLSLDFCVSSLRRGHAGGGGLEV